MSVRIHRVATATALVVAGLAAATCVSAAVITSPQFGAGWNLISLPLDPVNPSPAAVFKNESGSPIPISGKLHRYDHDAKTYRTYYSADPAPFGNVKRGEGYWLYLSSPTKISYDAYALSRLEIGLATPGWYLIGTPKDSAFPVQDIEVTNQGQAKTVSFYDAIYVERWLDPKLWWFASSGGYASCGFEAWCESSSLEPWKGYWVRARVSGLSVVAPFGDLPPAGFISARNGQFWLNGQTFRFVGANIRGMAHYGEGDILKFSAAQDRATNCATLRNQMKGRVARIFVASKYADPVEVGDRLRDSIAVAAAYDVYLLVCFTDMYINSEMHPMGDDVYYTQQGGYQMLNHTFFVSGYTVNYLPLVQYIVSRFKNEPRIFAWQLGNEIRDLSSSTTFVTWCEAVHDAIRAIDRYHMINVGAGRSLAGLTWSQAIGLYDDRFDFLVGHAYNGSNAEDDTGLASTLGKPFIVGEAGFDSTYYSDRPSQTNADISKWVNRGARGYLQWGLMATTFDNGDGDRYFGVDRVFHGYDWDAYMQVYSSWGNLLSGS